jgi:predicted unusual protein kinase regulating ubiquinone biosynthesis (AarF/ABC1/UbiB family)
LKLTGLTGRVSSSYTGQRLKELFLDTRRSSLSRSETHVRNAERIVETLGELKGAVMKVGQYMSIQADLLPKEFADVLASLQQSAPPVEYDLVASVITSEFGKEPEALFARFDPEPYASASIGQVHRAQLSDGTDVVVKVQYPDVERNIEGDLSNLKTILSTGSIMGYRKSDLEGVFAEIRDRLYEEIDYDQEMENLREFRRIFQRDKRIRVPLVYPPYSSGSSRWSTCPVILWKPSARLLTRKRIATILETCSSTFLPTRSLGWAFSTQIPTRAISPSGKRAR